MTDRDHFAAAALIGVLAKQGHSGWAIDHVPQLCWELADAMLRERGTAVSDNCATGNQPEIGCPVTEPIPKEKRAEVYFTTHDAVPAATAQSCDVNLPQAASELGNPVRQLPQDGTGSTQKPMAWAVAIGQEGFVLDDIFLREAEAESAFLWRQKNTTYGARIIPLYCHPQPMLTDEEREALCQAIDAAQGMACAELWTAATLRSLLERLK